MNNSYNQPDFQNPQPNFQNRQTGSYNPQPNFQNPKPKPKKPSKLPLVIAVVVTVVAFMLVVAGVIAYFAVRKIQEAQQETMEWFSEIYEGEPDNIYEYEDEYEDEIYPEVLELPATVEEEITEIVRMDKIPPEPPKKTEITVVPNDYGDPDIEPEPVEIVRQDPPQQDADEPFVKVEQMPSFQGGDLMTFRNWVQGRVKYPQFAQENGISGRVLLTFIVEKDGSVSNIQVLQAPDRSLSEEAVRVLQQSPRWTPGKQRGEAVRVKYTLPVDFRFQN